MQRGSNIDHFFVFCRLFTWMSLRQEWIHIPDDICGMSWRRRKRIGWFFWQLILWMKQTYWQVHSNHMHISNMVLNSPFQNKNYPCIHGKSVLFSLSRKCFLERGFNGIILCGLRLYFYYLIIEYNWWRGFWTPLPPSEKKSAHDVNWSIHVIIYYFSMTYPVYVLLLNY